MKQKRLRINRERCMGCCACEIACKMEYQLPRGLRFIVMKETEVASPQADQLHFDFAICRHCPSPACMEVCPHQAIIKRADGIVLVQEDKCTGCRLCLAACPWHVPQFGPGGIMKKCSLCAARLDAGLKPACQIACPAGAIRLEETE